jgi:hypothetical protein
MTPADRDRLVKCFAVAERGATPGERAAAWAAAARIAASVGLTLAEATALLARPAAAARKTRYAPPRRRPFPWEQPKAPFRPVTVQEVLRQKAETEAWRKRRAATAARRRKRAAEEDDRQTDP